MSIIYKESPMTVSESILTESRSSIDFNHDPNPAASYFFNELIRKPSFSIRVIDVVFSFIAIVLTLPFYPFVMVALKLTSKESVFTTQQVVGFRGFSFKIKTFRTMSDGKQTRIGRFLYLSRIEYAPLFFYVLLGRLSLVGVTLRAETTATLLNNRVDWFYKVYAASAGIITLASVKGYGFATRDYSDQLRQAEFDMLYVMNQSVSMYVRILLRTLFDVPVNVSLPVVRQAAFNRSAHSNRAMN
jgi:lipopolysaccharide/colanic/teichoic acid biosynthesis glycosyltransferase